MWHWYIHICNTEISFDLIFDLILCECSSHRRKKDVIRWSWPVREFPKSIRIIPVRMCTPYTCGTRNDSGNAPECASYGMHRERGETGCIGRRNVVTRHYTALLRQSVTRSCGIEGRIKIRVSDDLRCRMAVVTVTRRRWFRAAAIKAPPPLRPGISPSFGARCLSRYFRDAVFAIPSGITVASARGGSSRFNIELDARCAWAWGSRQRLTTTSISTKCGNK